MDRSTKALSMISQTHVKLEESCEGNDTGLCLAKVDVRRAMSAFAMILPTLSGHADGIFLTRIGLMLCCCILEGRRTDETCGQDLCGEACAALVDLLPPPPSKVEAGMEPVDEYYPHVVMKQAYSILHIVLEGRPGLMNAVLQETTDVVNILEYRRQECQNKERKQQGELVEHNKQMDMRIQRVWEEDTVAWVSRGELRAKLMGKRAGIKSEEITTQVAGPPAPCLSRMLVFTHVCCRILSHAGVC